jgi:DUF4097 and DUF4098 domain-containing protein YvlB
MSLRSVLLVLSVTLLVGLGARKFSACYSADAAQPLPAATIKAATDEVVLDERFPVSPGENLDVNVSHADVTIRSGQVREARIQISIDGSDMDRARRFYEHLNFEVSKSGETVLVHTNTRGSFRMGGGRVSVDVQITIPEVFNADVEVSHGDVEVNRLKGDLSFNSSHGDLDIGVIAGNSLSITTSHGDLDADEIVSEKLRLQSSHGDIEVDRVTAEVFEARNAHGNIEIESAEGRADVASSHGNISIRFVRADGGEFTNSHGNIELSAPSETAADLDLAASDVEISGSYNFQGTQRDNRIQGTINGGGPKLVARTDHGNIRLRAN